MLPLGLGLALVAGCSGGDEDDAAPAAPSDAASAAESPAVAAGPRLAFTYGGGVQVLDATTLDVAEDIPLDGFNRLNPVGDDRHLLVSTTGGFQALDTRTAQLTDVRFPAEDPGHVVVHAGRTVLFDDATGEVTAFDADAVADGGRELRELTTREPHHGVAVELSDGTLVVSDGDEDERSGVRVLDAEGQELAASDECPGVHGEAVAADEAVVIGCEDGLLLWHDGKLTKVDSPDDYGRIGNQAASEDSPVVLGDYKSDPDADMERPTRVSLTDTRTAELALVDLPASYSFRSLGRGQDGAALVLGTDGQLHVIDPETGELARSIPVTGAWEEPEDWQDPRPTLLVLDSTAYVTDPAARTVSAVDLEAGEVAVTADLEVSPNELTGVPA